MVKTNIKDLIKYEKFYKKSPFGVKDLLVHEDLLFISYSNEIRKDCFNTSIIFAKINNKFLEFKKFFNPQNCISIKNKFGSFYATWFWWKNGYFRQKKYNFYNW